MNLAPTVTLFAKDGTSPVFRAPREAHAFALTLTSFERGCFTWVEWSQCLSEEIASARERGEIDGDGDRYYEYWLTALEKLAANNKLMTFSELLARKEEWDQAAQSTPHGTPIELARR